MKTSTALMGACLSADQYDTAIKVFEQMLKSDETPDGYALNLAIRAYCEKGKFEEATKILSEQKDGYHEFSGKEIMFCYNYVIQSSLEQNQSNVTRAVFTELLDSGYIPSKMTFKAIAQGMGLPRKEHFDQGKQILSHRDVADDFKFLLFVLDSIEKRKLFCSGLFYTNIIFETARLGGLPKKIGSLIVESKKCTMDLLDNNCLPNPSNQEYSWELLFKEWDSRKYRNEKPKLPPIRVRTNGNVIRRILTAEQSVSYGINRRSNKRRIR